MGTTSFTLGPHLLRAGLRELEERKKRLDALRAHLDEGLEDIRCGRVVDDDEIDIARSWNAPRPGSLQNTPRGGVSDPLCKRLL
jgi:hypothetical protein